MVSCRDHLACCEAADPGGDGSGGARSGWPSSRDPSLLDVRERDEYEQGCIPGAVHIPRGNLETRIERACPTARRPVIIYCAAGTRSAFAAKTLTELGYTDVVSMAGGFSGWKQNGHDWTLPRTLTPEQFERYSRHVLIPEVGEEGQLQLLDSKVLLIGAGGLGSPAGALPGGGRRRHARHHRRRRRRRLEPPAPDPAHGRPHRHAQGRLGRDRDQRAQPGRRRGQVRRAAHVRERARRDHRATT